MSDLGPLAFTYRDSDSAWRGRLQSERPEYSEEMAGKIDEEIEKIIGGCYDRAQQILLDRRVALDRLAKRLIEVETGGTGRTKRDTGIN